VDHKKHLGGLLVAGVLAAAASATADELFLRLEGVQGESRDARHKDEIDVLSYSQSTTGPFAQSAAGAGGGAGKTTCGPVKVTKYLDRASPRLSLYAANGQHIPRATISFRKAGSKDGSDYYRVTLDDVVVTDVQQTGEGGTRYAENARESVSLMGRRFTWDYVVQAPDGRPAGAAKSFWDCVQGKGG
jgi:type VI secretion system secreted protein Hcp